MHRVRFVLCPFDRISHWWAGNRHPKQRVGAVA
jgi:hypothetical protein